MATKKKSNRNNWIGLGKFFLSLPIVVLVILFPWIVAYKLANYFHWSLYLGFVAPLILFGGILAKQVLARFIDGIQLKPFASTLRDGIVIWISFTLFWMIFAAPSSAILPEIRFPVTCLVAPLVAISFAFVFGTSELRQKIRDFPKAFKKKKPRKRKQEGSNELPPDIG